MLKRLMLMMVAVGLLCGTAVGQPAPDPILKVQGFVGETLDTISGETANGFTGGMFIDYRLSNKLGLNLATYHSRRRTEKTLEGLIFEADSIEWQAGLRFAVKSLNEGDTEVCFIGQGGFVQLLDTPGDVIDNHFVGVGIDHMEGDFKGSSIAVGYGKTDIFAEHNNSRFKVRTQLMFANPKLPMGAGVFLAGLLDSDLREGNDGMRIIFGTTVPFDRLFN